jgi:4-carboxymuconolactone decarboxylase
MTPEDWYREIMLAEPPPAESPFETEALRFAFGQVWPRPGLSVRDRRLVTLSCVAGAGAQEALGHHVYAALASGDLTPEQLDEFALQFAAYSGWPKAVAVDRAGRTQWARLHAERGEPAPPWPAASSDDLGPAGWERRLADGAASFTEVNRIPAPPPLTPYLQAGVLGFVFGHLWLRPHLTRRERRLMTIPCAGLSGAAEPIGQHVGSALTSGDLTVAEMDELVLQFTAYCGFPHGAMLHGAVLTWKAQRTAAS